MRVPAYALRATLRKPVRPEGKTASTVAVVSERDPAQELHVRLTAERLLGDHLRGPADVSGEDAQRRPPSPDESFWRGISLDLTGAFPIVLDLSGAASVVSATFARATFSRGALFSGATFSGDAWFGGATFSGAALFGGATFSGAAWFGGATFSGAASFDGATFSSGARFDLATFSSGASFRGATFSGGASFRGATVSFFASFDGATFSSGARFDGATFSGDASFDGTHVHVLNLGDPDLNEGGDGGRRVWPNGWTVRANADDPTRGTLVPTPPASSLEPSDG